MLGREREERDLRERVVIAGVIAALATGCGGSGDDEVAATTRAEQPAAPPVTVRLTEENGSGQSGTATLRAVDTKTFEVVIDVNPPAREQLAHIHKGTCADYRKLMTASEQYATVVDELQDVEGGHSESTVYAAPLESRTTGRHSINVHGPNGAYDVAACGNIPKR